MKVWIIVPDYGYEGYGEPEGAFSSRELAEAAVKAIDLAAAPREIFEFEIDAPKNDT